MLITNDSITNAEAHSAGSKRGRSQGRTTLRARRRNKAAPQPFPSAPFFGPPWELPGTGARLFLQLLGTWWATVLTGAQRTAFEAIAAGQFITTNNGAQHFVTGYQWFVWYNSVNYQNTFSPTYPIDPINYPPLSNPPGSWNPPDAPTTPETFSNIASTLWTFNAYTTPSVTLGWGMMLVPYWRQNNRLTSGKPTIRTNLLITSTTAVDGLFSMTLGLGGVLPDDSYIKGKQVILRVTSAAPDYVPSDPLEFTWPT